MVDSRQVQEWLDKLRRGSLTEADLEAALSGANGAGRRQRLLYLQAESTAVDSAVSGMSIVEDGEVRIPSGDFDEWQYHTVLEAVNDGWRVIKFPELSLLYEHLDEVWLGCEFILEK